MRAIHFQVGCFFHDLMRVKEQLLNYAGAFGSGAAFALEDG
jgi:hypothetical protein